MIREKSVDLDHQTLMAVLPFVGFWAFVKIKKFRKYTLFMFLFGGIFGIVGFILGLTGGTEAEFTMMQTFSAGVVMPFVTYYCRKWSREWNEKFEEITKSPLQ